MYDLTSWNSHFTRRQKEADFFFKCLGYTSDQTIILKVKIIKLALLRSSPIEVYPAAMRSLLSSHSLSASLAKKLVNTKYGQGLWGVKIQKSHKVIWIQSVEERGRNINVWLVKIWLLSMLHDLCYVPSSFQHMRLTVQSPSPTPAKDV